MLSGNYTYISGDALGTKTEVWVLPAINIGAGVKIKAGSNFIAVEVTPTGNGSGIFAGVGYSFN
jgi:hypothetical protein